MLTRTTIITGFALASAVCSSYGQSESDLHGIRWGVQSVAELKTAISAFAKTNECHFRFQSFKMWRGYSIGGIDYKSYTKIEGFPLIEGVGLSQQIYMDAFVIQDQNAKVVAVQLEKADWTANSLAFHEIRTYLEGKYSKPKSDETLKNAEINIEKRLIVWETGNSIIELVQIAIPDQGVYRIGLTYRGKAVEAKEEKR